MTTYFLDGKMHKKQIRSFIIYKVNIFLYHIYGIIWFKFWAELVRIWGRILKKNKKLSEGKRSKTKIDNLTQPNWTNSTFENILSILYFCNSFKGEGDSSTKHKIYESRLKHIWDKWYKYSVPSLPQKKVLHAT